MLRSQKEKAIEFRKMHQSGDILVLPNAWDVPSARIFEQAGFPAIGTSSAAIAISLGYPDGQKITREDRKSTRLNSSHTVISYAVFCLKKKKLEQRVPKLRAELRNK